MNPVHARLRRGAIETRLVRLNWTKSELATRVGISRSHLSDLLASRKQPGPEVRARLLKALGATFDELFKVSPAIIEDDS